MKEAAGEANLTVITIVAVALVGAAAALIIPSLLTSTGKKACCSSYGGVWEANSCKTKPSGTVITEASYWDATNNKCV